MTFKISLVLIISAAGLLFSCASNNSSNKKNLEIQSVSKNNPSSCLEINWLVTAPNINQMDSLMGKTEMEIAEVLGIPQRTQLYERGQKFFFYAINCDSVGNYDKSMRLRFTALSYVNEVLIIDDTQ